MTQRNHAPIHLPAKARDVYDVTGAGDTVVAVLAAGIVVGKVGTATATVAELECAIGNDENGIPLSVLMEDDLVEAVNRAKSREERIVMVAGIFGRLNEHHVSFLERSKQMGDRLLVAIYDDNTAATRRKDNKRVAPLESRMAVLAALRMVDWLTPCSDGSLDGLGERVIPDMQVTY